ncbi:hypothetical protein RIF29_21801 [Crotalaria pallida]|uniref:Uncharacterized protein n=1 Tax=Crotalaria pallida TaxID=3830 RepID=A0AAN9F847_CROPI
MEEESIPMKSSIFSDLLLGSDDDAGLEEIINHLQLPTRLMNVDETPDIEAFFDLVAPPAAQGTGNSSGSGGDPLPVSGSMIIPSSQSPLGAGIGAPAAPSLSILATQQPKSRARLSADEKGKKVITNKKIPFEGLSRHYPLALPPSNHQNQVQNTEREALLGTKPRAKQLRIEDSSSSRNVKMKMTLSNNNEQLAPTLISNQPALPIQQLAPTRVENNPNFLHNSQQMALNQVSCLLSRPSQAASENYTPVQTRRPNSLYDPVIYEPLGLPMDPLLRNFYLASKRKRDSYEGGVGPIIIRGAVCLAYMPSSD